MPEWLRPSLESLEASSTGVVDLLREVDSSLRELREKTTDLVQRQEIERIADDTRAALDSARGAQGAARQLQADVRGLQKTVEELGLGTLRTRVDELERIIDRHVKSDHRRTK